MGIIFKQIKKLKLQKETRDNYEGLYKACLGEFKFEKLQNDFLLSVLQKVKSLCETKTNHELIKKVIENGKERRNLDMMIHADIFFN